MYLRLYGTLIAVLISLKLTKNYIWCTNRSIEEAQLLDLKHLLMEAKQKIPEFLAEIGGELETGAGLSTFFIDYQVQVSLYFIKYA